MSVWYNLFNTSGVLVDTFPSNDHDNEGHVDYPAEIERNGKVYFFWQRWMGSFYYIEIGEDFRDKIRMLWEWQYSNTGCFTHRLYELIAKADVINMLRLEKGFPIEVAVFKKWRDSKNQDDFFKRFLNPGETAGRAND